MARVNSQNAAQPILDARSAPRRGETPEAAHPFSPPKKANYRRWLVLSTLFTPRRRTAGYAPQRHPSRRKPLQKHDNRLVCSAL